VKDSSNLEINYSKIADGVSSLAIFVSWMVGPRRFKFLRLLRFYHFSRRLASEVSGAWDRPVSHSNQTLVRSKDNATFHIACCKEAEAPLSIPYTKIPTYASKLFTLDSANSYKSSSTKNRMTTILV